MVWTTNVIHFLYASFANVSSLVTFYNVQCLDLLRDIATELIKSFVFINLYLCLSMVIFHPYISECLWYFDCREWSNLSLLKVFAKVFVRTMEVIRFKVLKEKKAYYYLVHERVDTFNLMWAFLFLAKKILMQFATNN